jgi:hypothetical protein
MGIYSPFPQTFLTLLWEGSDDETLAHNHYRRSLGRGGQLRSPGAFASVSTASL